MVSLTFDDGWEDNYTSVLPLLTQYGFKSTQYYATTYIQEQSDEIYKIQAFAAAGHEIGSHTITHPYLTKLTVANMDKELLQSRTYLESLIGVGKITEFASPYGDYNSQVITEIKKYYRSHRSTDEGFNSKDNFNIMNLRVQNMTNTTSLAQYEEWIRKAQTDKTWLVIVYHRIGENPDQFETAPADFAAQMQFLSQSGLAVKTVGQALDIVLPQMK
jgi:peptidoglycan/xylan/chitin deacetylase (PgdA/CDA1 family)